MKGLVTRILIKMEGAESSSCMKISVSDLTFDWEKIEFNPFENAVLKWFIEKGIALVRTPLKVAFKKFGLPIVTK